MNDVDTLLLEHFGTKGMHWGVRKTPEQKTANRNVKAKTYEDKAKEIQTRINKLSTAKYPSLYRGRIQKLEEKKQTALDDAERKRKGKLSKRQKQVVIGAGVAAAIAATYITYSSLNSGNARRLTDKGKDFALRKRGLPWKLDQGLRDPNLSPLEIHDKVVKHINPKFGQPGTKQNCRRATYAYEMRRRGYDVQATRTTNARGQDITGVYNVLHPNVNLVPPGRSGILTRIIGESRKSNKPFTTAIQNNPHLNLGTIVEPHRIMESLTNHPDGARGELGVTWRSGGGHSLAWEKIKGNVTVFDTQTGKMYSSQHELEGLVRSVSTAGFTRLDNRPLNYDFIRRWLKNA